jgi:hypothetical protein
MNNYFNNQPSSLTGNQVSAEDNAYASASPRNQVAFRRSRFPGKEQRSVSFNLTALGRELLKSQAATACVSNGDYVEMLIRERAGMPAIKLPSASKQTGPKGGAKSFFFGKNRGTTTACCVTPLAHRLLDEQVAASRMSRGDYIECLLRDKAGLMEGLEPQIEEAKREVPAIGFGIFPRQF